jgi:hypothetical protein
MCNPRQVSSLSRRIAWGLAFGALCAAPRWLGGSGVAVWAATPTPAFPEQQATQYGVDAPQVFLAPYVWKRSGSGATARAEATMPGAYLKFAFRDSDFVHLLIDGSANEGCPATAMPVVDYSVDEGPFQTVQLTQTSAVYALPLAEDLEQGGVHRIEVYFRSACLGPQRWQASTVHLRVAGIALTPGGALLDGVRRPKLAIGFGDSITEGVCNEGSCPYYSNLLMNNARTTWFPLVCAGLQCEYGQLGTGGQGMVRPIEIPPLPQTWDRYDADASRLTGGLLLPEPDYVFCAMGTNDFRTVGDRREQIDITEAYTNWLAAVRKACPRSLCFCVVPPLGWHVAEIAAAVAARHAAGDSRVFLIDTAPLKTAFHESHGTQLAPDGVHPSVYGNALLATLIAAEAARRD